MHAIKSDLPITLELSSGGSVTGKVAWWDLGAAAIETDGGEVGSSATRWSDGDPLAPDVADEPEDEGLPAD